MNEAAQPLAKLALGVPAQPAHTARVEGRSLRAVWARTPSRSRSETVERRETP
jgi:hypothetical protein